MTGDLKGQGRFESGSGPETGTSSSANLAAPPVDYRQQFAADCSRYVDTFLGSQVLVVGCGGGGDCHPFVDFGARRVHGIDTGPHLGSKFSHRRVSYVRAAAEAMPLATS